MAERKIIYSIKINGVEQSTKDVKKLGDEVNNLGNSINSVDMDTFQVSGIENVNSEITQTSEKFDAAGNSVKNFDKSLDSVSSENIGNVGKNLDLTTEKVDKLTFAGEKGFKGLSDALKLFGIDTSILDNVKEGLGAIGDLLDSNSKLSDVAYNSAPAAKQAETIKELAGAQKASTVATSAGAAATTAASTATKGATFATQAFNVALRALPFLAVIGAITTVIALYSSWKKKQEEVKQTFDEFISGLNAGLDEYNQKLENQIQILENIADANLTNIDSQISGLEKQIELLEIQGGKEDEILAIKKQILAAQQAQLNTQIELNNNTINTLGVQLNNNTQLLADLREGIFLREEAIRLGLKGAQTDEQIEKKNEEILKLKEQINVIDKDNNALLQKRTDLTTKNLGLANELALKKEFDLKILNATNKVEQERLSILKEQEKIKLSEELKKIGDQIQDNYEAAAEFNEEFFRLYNELQQSVLKDKIKIELDSGNLNKAFELLKKSIGNFKFEFKTNTIDIESKLRKPLEDAILKLQENVNLSKNALVIDLKLKGFKDEEIDKIIKQIGEKTKKINDGVKKIPEGEIRLFDNKIILEQSEEYVKTLQSVGETVENAQNKIESDISYKLLKEPVVFKNLDDFNTKLGIVQEKLKKGLTIDRSPGSSDSVLASIDDYVKGFKVVDGVLNENIQKFIAYQIQTRNSAEIVRTELTKEIKVGNVDTKSYEVLQKYFTSILAQSSSVVELKKDIENLSSGGQSTNTVVDQAAQFKTLGDKLKEVSDLIKSAESEIDGSLTNIQNIVSDNLDGLQEKFDNGGNLNFKLFLNKDIQEQLKATLTVPIDATIADLEKKKKELQEAFAGIFEDLSPNDSEGAELLKKELNKILAEIDAAIAKLNGKKDETINEVDLTFKEFVDKYGQLIADTLQASVDLFAAINDMQIQSLEQQMDAVDEYYDGIADKYEEEIERTQDFYDQQAQIASDSLAKINDYENQLKTARGARAEFLLKLIAAEQDKAQKAEKQKLDALKKEQLAKKAAAKAEEERAAELDALARKRFNLQKANNMAQIILSTTVAVMKALAQDPGPPTTIPLAVITGVLGAVQLGIAASAKYEQGGILDVMENGGQLSGPRHSQGGLAVVNQQGKKVAEVEGGEYIINRKSVDNPVNKRVLDNINSTPNYMNDKVVVPAGELRKLEASVKQANRISRNRRNIPDVEILENGGSAPITAGGLTIMNNAKKVANLEGGEFVINRKAAENYFNRRLLDKIDANTMYMNNKYVVKRRELSELKEFASNIKKQERISFNIPDVQILENGGEILLSNKNMQSTVSKLIEMSSSPKSINQAKNLSVKIMDDESSVSNSQNVNNNTTNRNLTSNSISGQYYYETGGILNKLNSNYNTGGILSNISTMSSTPDFSSLINAVTIAQQPKAEAVNYSPVVQANIDSEAISSAIRSGMENVSIQASIQDIRTSNGRQVEIESLRRI